MANWVANMKHTAASQIPLIDFRRRRAEAFAAALIQEVSDVLHEDLDCSAVFDRLFKVLHDNGACWTTEKERISYGFEPRDELGWSPSERIAQKQAEMQAMLTLTNAPFIIKDNK